MTIFQFALNAHILAGTVVLAAFWTERRDTPVHCEDRRWPRMAAVATTMIAVSLALGLGAELALKVAKESAERALDQHSYIQSVLQVKGKDAAQP